MKSKGILKMRKKRLGFPTNMGELTASYNTEGKHLIKFKVVRMKNKSKINMIYFAPMLAHSYSNTKEMTRENVRKKCTFHFGLRKQMTSFSSLFFFFNYILFFETI